MIVLAGCAALQSRSSHAHAPEDHERHWSAALPATTLQ
jgi:hypothetical protein